MTHFASRWRKLGGALALAALGACAPRGPRVPTVPVVVIRDTSATTTRPPRDTVVVPATPTVDTAAFPEALLAPTVRVGLVVDTSRVEITSAGAFSVRTEGGQELANLPAGATAMFADAGSTITLTSRTGSTGSGPGGSGLAAP
ncbi:MAG TPA: hypothetical protein VEY93_12855, partial [Longimicrobium sp.]|nr:hypothetical protein [Longimicrobium sp.]